MPAYVLVYRTPSGGSPSPTPESMAAWQSWFEGISEHVTDMGRPVFERGAVGNLDPRTTQLGGYSIITADDLEAAVTAAKGCPVLGRDGGVEIGQLGDLP